MNKTLKAFIYEVDVEKNLFANSFSDTIHHLAQMLDDEDGKNIRILDTYKNKETSIWFDSFDYINKFENEPIFKDTICFLLAKDMEVELSENKENKSLGNFSKDTSQTPKIPAHCIFLKNKNILITEYSQEFSNAISVIKRGIKEKLATHNIEFKPKIRDDALERLQRFIENIYIQLN